MLKTARDNPAVFFATCARLVPADVVVTMRQSLPGDLSPGDWAIMVEVVQAVKPLDFSFKIRPCFQWPAKALLRTEDSRETPELDFGAAAPPLCHGGRASQIFWRGVPCGGPLCTMPPTAQSGARIVNRTASFMPRIDMIGLNRTETAPQ